MVRKISMIALLVLLVPGMAFAMGKGGSGGTGGGGGGTGGSGGGGGTADYDVIIVGAGSSGLYAAYELNNLGFSIRVIEGRPRHGGRVWSQNKDSVRANGQKITDIMVDAFAEGVTGPASSNWHASDINSLDKSRLVQIYNESAKDDLLFSVSGSTVLSSEVTKKDNPDIYDYWDFYYGADAYEGPDVDVESYLCDTLNVCRGVTPTFHLYVQSMPGGEYTAHIDQIGMRSLANVESLWELGDGEWGFATSTWLDTLDELYFNEVLGDVEFGNDVTGIDTSGSVAVVTGGGGINYTAHAVVVTIPLGNLKAGDVAFTPALSATKQNAIDNLGFGNGGKMFLQFDSQVQPDATTSFFTEGGNCGYAWNYWYKGGDGKNVWVCWATGEVGTNLDTRYNNDAARIAAAVSDMDGMYAGTPYTDAFVAGFWKRTDDKKHQLGSYTYPTIGSWPSDGSNSLAQDLAAPESTKLYFAGESTSHNHPAIVVGAMETGLRAAGEVDADHDPQGAGGSGGTGGTGGTGGSGGGGGGGGTMHVDSISVVDVNTNGPWHEGHATITILDGGGAPVSGASVDASYTGSSSGSTSGTTNGSGNVTLESSRNKNSWSGEFCVDDVTLGGSTYDSGANVETCDSN